MLKKSNYTAALSFPRKRESMLLRFLLLQEGHGEQLRKLKVE